MELSNIQKTDKRVSLFIVIQVSLMGVKNILVQGLPFLMSINEALNIWITALVSVLYLYAFILVWRRTVCGSGKLFALFILASIMFTLLIFPENTVFISQYYIRWIVVFFFTAYLICKLNTFAWLQHYMLMGSYLMTAAGVIYALLVYTIGHSVTSDWSTYSMSMSNVVMWAVMWQLHAFFKQGNKVSLFFAIAGFVVIFLYGSRNPLLAIFVYSIIALLDQVKSKRTSGIISVWVVAILLGLIVLNLKPIIGSLTILFEQFGLSSRSLELVVNADTEDFSTGRNEIHKNVRTLIWDNPIIGTGICGDQAKLDEMAHSLYLNIFSTYGIIVGTVFLIVLIVLCLKGLKGAKKQEHQILVLYMCMVFPRGFTGGDMWTSDVFWWMMGIVFMILSNKQRVKKNAVSYIRQESVSMG